MDEYQQHNTQKPTVVLTPRDLEGMGEPVSAVLAKPFDVHELVRTAQACLS